MRLEHLNIVITDIEKSLEFYKAAFPHWQIRGNGEMEWYGAQRRWVHFGDDNTYITFNDRGTEENRDLKGTQLGLAHFAFETDNLDGVRERLSLAGFEPNNLGADEPFRRNHYFYDPDGFEIEFVEYTSDSPTERNLYR